MSDRPKVGVGVIVVRDDKVLMGKRQGSHGQATWSFGGGHLEFGESIEDCARRELREEAGIVIDNIRRVAFTNDVFPDKHYVTLFVAADYVSGEPTTNKCEMDSWEWFAWDNLPEPLFLPVAHLVKQGYNPFSSS